MISSPYSIYGGRHVRHTFRLGSHDEPPQELQKAYTNSNRNIWVSFGAIRGETNAGQVNERGTLPKKYADNLYENKDA